MTPGPLRKVWNHYTFFCIVLQSQQSMAQNSMVDRQALSRGGHANKHHSHSCDRARSTRILRKWWSRYAFFHTLAKSTVKARKPAQSTIKALKISTVNGQAAQKSSQSLTRGRSCDCRVYWLDLPLPCGQTAQTSGESFDPQSQL